jgi:FtsP/CotA-like multicopper oxidase with cupredoxin domain
LRLLTLAVLSAALALPAVHRNTPSTVVLPNPNTERAGSLRNRVLTVTLEAKPSVWYLNGASRSPMTIEAFAEPGKAPLMPGPLVRAPAGTEIRFSIRNALARPLTFFVPASIHGGPDRFDEADSVIIAPGAVETLVTRATSPGNYLYRGTTPTGASAKANMAGLLAGAIVIDTAHDSAARDRVFVIMMTLDSALAAYADTAKGSLVAAPSSAGRTVFTINGLSWPNTERQHAKVGESLHWRILNASFDVHPMHLHGFYYRVDKFQAPRGTKEEAPAPGQMVVTQVMSPFSTMSMSWSPNRPGNWLFHCHFSVHLQPDSLSAARDDPYLHDMTGLLIGTIVSGPAEVVAAGNPSAVRHLRLVAESYGPLHEHPNQVVELDSMPFMHFVLEENGRRTEAGRDFSPELDLVRGEPVAITIVNHLPLPTSIHWHGIELDDSYMDGVAGFSGSGTHLTPEIAPGDSFVARFTPPRAGTFMYHAHVDDVREELAGLEGALIVRGRGATRSPDDHVLFLKGVAGSPVHPLEVDGRADPDTIVLHAGQPARFRILNLSTFNPVPQVWLTARRDSAAQIADDSLLERWRLVAKDGFDRPDGERMLEPARRVVAIGETYDFEYTARQPGTLRLEVRTNGVRHALLIRVPIRVE